MRTRMVPCSEYLTALLSRLSRHCSRRLRSVLSTTVSLSLAHLHLHPQAFLHALRLDHGNSFLYQLIERKGFNIDVGIASLNLRDVDHVGDQGKQVFGRAVYASKMVLLLVRQRPGNALQYHAGKADDGVERGAQLVRH